MELSGAFSNPLQTNKDLLNSLSCRSMSLPKHGVRDGRPLLRPRAGDIKGAVLRAVDDSPRTLKEIHRLCEELLDRRVTHATVKDCVHTHARGSNAIFERVSRGTYRRRP